MKQPKSIKTALLSLLEAYWRHVFAKTGKNMRKQAKICSLFLHKN